MNSRAMSQRHRAAKIQLKHYDTQNLYRYTQVLINVICMNKNDCECNSESYCQELSVVLYRSGGCNPGAHWSGGEKSIIAAQYY